MDKKSKYLLWAFILVAIVSAIYGYRTILGERDFVVNSTTICNPETESCFKWCDEEECEDEYYNKIIKNGQSIPVCNEALEECESLVCEPEEQDCRIITCSEETVVDGEICTNPADFQNKNKEEIVL